MRLSRRHLASRRRGFTLVELMVSLVAGVIIAIAVVGLARTATNTFHEQVRISGTEMSLRVASERLRADLQRAGYMSTGNIRWDPKIAARPGAFGANNSRYASTTDLQSIEIFPGLSRVDAAPFGSEGPYALATKNGLNPDSILIAGNFTTTDAYRAQIVSNVGTGCGGLKLVMKPGEDAGVSRLMQFATTAADAAKNVQNAFTPGTGDFLVRAVDPSGFAHFAQVCAAGATATGQPAPNDLEAWIELRPDAGGKAILDPLDTNGTGGAREQDYVTVSPLQRVQWYIGPNTNALLAPDPAIEPTPHKFNLYRRVLNAAGVAVVDEVVAEYAVDLKFGIVVHDPYAAGAANRYLVYDLDDTSGKIAEWTNKASATTQFGAGPQRVRSVRYRVSLRAPIPDRTANLQVAPAPYISRYCMENVAIGSCKQFARVRTFVSEVALVNQARNFY
jgi:prepilin-type N-terminal cleavage/methylation domain-containing protein